MPITVEDVVRFERAHLSSSYRDHLIREETGLSPTVYTAAMLAMLRRGEIHVVDPILGNRLHRKITEASRSRRKATGLR